MEVDIRLERRVRVACGGDAPALFHERATAREQLRGHTLRREPGSPRLDHGTEFVDRIEVGPLERGDLEPASAVLDEEPLLAQQAERGHHRLPGDLQLCRELVLRGAVADGVEDAFVHLFDQGLLRLQRFHVRSRAS